ncbi:hypothetical protein HDE_01374 [Halotydeus destructor]|nr:hypothetical protein HDE_01374 [Halotydeus destructor]
MLNKPIFVVLILWAIYAEARYVRVKREQVPNKGSPMKSMVYMFNLAMATVIGYLSTMIVLISIYLLMTPVHEQGGDRGGGVKAMKVSKPGQAPPKDFSPSIVAPFLKKKESPPKDSPKEQSPPSSGSPSDSPRDGDGLGEIQSATSEVLKNRSENEFSEMSTGSFSEPDKTAASATDTSGNLAKGTQSATSVVLRHPSETQFSQDSSAAANSDGGSPPAAADTSAWTAGSPTFSPPAETSAASTASPSGGSPQAETSAGAAGSPGGSPADSSPKKTGSGKTRKTKIVTVTKKKVMYFVKHDDGKETPIDPKKYPVPATASTESLSLEPSHSSDIGSTISDFDGNSMSTLDSSLSQMTQNSSTANDKKK